MSWPYVVITALLLLWLAFWAGHWLGSRQTLGGTRIEVGTACDGSRRLQNTVSVRLVRGVEILCMERVNLLDDDYIEQLAKAVANMKQRRRALQATRRLGRE